MLDGGPRRHLEALGGAVDLEADCHPAAAGERGAHDLGQTVLQLRLAGRVEPELDRHARERLLREIDVALGVHDDRPERRGLADGHASIP